MAIDIKFDLVGNPEPPTIILANRNGNILGQLDVNHDSIDLKDKLNDASEFSFTLNKYVDGKITVLWDKVVDFKLVYCKEWDCWFEISVELDEATETVKTVFCTQLGQAELSQIILYNIEINTEKDIERDDYKISILRDEKDPKASILDRLLEKAPHYSIVHVDDTIKNIQRSFSFDGVSIHDAFKEIAEEIGCLFVFHSNSGENGKIQRTISVYDLQQNCLNPDCRYRGEFTDICPKCNGENGKYGVKQGYGEDTLIFVTSDELASNGIELTTDTDAVKNCFKLEAGDDLMTATVRNCNPNGTDYIWYFSDSVKEDMSAELVEGIEGYDKLYKDYYNNHESNLNGDLVNRYNSLVKKYEGYYNTKSTCLNCDYEGVFEDVCPKCGGTDVLSGKILRSIPTKIKGYSALMNAYYNTIDLAMYLKSGLMPTVDMSNTNAEEQAELLMSAFPSTIATNNKSIESITETTADSAALSMAKTIVKSTYKVEIDSSTYDENTYIWTGNFSITNYSDDTDKYPKLDTDKKVTVTVNVNNDTETFIRQKIEKALNKEDTDDYSVSGLFEKEYTVFCAELKKYALNPLKSFYDACDACFNILIEQGAGDNNENPDLYKNLYEPYYNKSSAIADEIKIREEEIAIIEGVWDDITEEGSPKLIAKGLRQYIEECRSEIQDVLDFEKYLGTELWLEFCTYRREDTYSNDNYISDGLDNAKLFEKALEFYEVAENEIYKSAELQHSISASLNNLLAIEKFKPLVDSFKVGNWIRVQVDDRIFKLRLLEYEIDFGDFDNISVEFSDVTKVKDGATDIESVLSQASSMATSYSSVQRQANKGTKAKDTIEQWIEDGLSSALVQIQNNDSEEISMTKNGLLCRSFDDITGKYSPEQLKITHNIMAYTADNWGTVSSALGKHKYIKWQNNQWIEDTDYGFSSKFVTAGYVTGSQIIGGEIVSSNYKQKESGTYFNLIDGDFEIAGGNIAYDTKDKTLTLRNVTIEWANTNSPEITDITGLDEYLDQLDKLENQLDNRTETWYQASDPSVEWNTDDLESLHVGDLWHYTGETGAVNGSQRTKNSEWIWQETNGQYKWVSIEISDDVFDAIDGKAQIFTTTPTPPYYVGDLWVQGSTGDILHCVTSKSEGQSYNSNDWVKSGKYTDDTKANSAYALADSAKGVADNAKIIGDKLVNGLGFKETEIADRYIISPVIAGGTLLIGDTSGTYAQITTEGQLICTGAKISGDIVANSLTLGNNVSISSNKISGLSSVATSGKYSDLIGAPTIPDSVSDLGLDTSTIIFKGDITQATKKDSNGISYVETSVPSSSGTIKYSTYNADDYLVFGRSKGTNSSGNNYVCVSKDGLLTARNALIYGTVYATDGEFTGSITGSTISGSKFSSTNEFNDGIVIKEHEQEFYYYGWQVGSLYIGDGTLSLGALDDVDLLLYSEQDVYIEGRNIYINGTDLKSYIKSVVASS